MMSTPSGEKIKTAVIEIIAVLEIGSTHYPTTGGGLIINQILLGGDPDAHVKQNLYQKSLEASKR